VTVNGNFPALIVKLKSVEHACDDGDLLVALKRASVFADEYSSFIADACQAAYNGGATKKAIAQALDVPVGTFRGMVRS